MLHLTTKECNRTAKCYNSKILKAKQTCNKLQQSVSHQTILKLLYKLGVNLLSL